MPVALGRNLAMQVRRARHTQVDGGAGTAVAQVQHELAARSAGKPACHPRSRAPGRSTSRGSRERTPSPWRGRRCAETESLETSARPCPASPRHARATLYRVAPPASRRVPAGYVGRCESRKAADRGLLVETCKDARRYGTDGRHTRGRDAASSNAAPTWPCCSTPGCVTRAGKAERGAASSLGSQPCSSLRRLDPLAQISRIASD